MCEQPYAGGVTDGPQPLARPQPRVDRDPVRAGLHADRLQAKPVHAGAPAGGHEQAVAAQFAAVVEDQHVVLSVAPRSGRVHAKQQLDAIGAQHLAERFAQRRGLTREHMGGPLGEGHLAAEAPHGLGHLRADRPAAQNEQAARDRLHAGHLAVGPHAAEFAQARDGRNDRIRAGRQHDMPGGVACAVDLDRTGPGELAGPPQQVDSLARQPALLPGVGVVRDHEVTPGQRRRGVELRGGRRLACLVHRLAGTQQRLGRDARPVGAFPPDQVALDHGNAQPAVGQLAGAVLAGRAAAQHDHVIVAHVVTGPAGAW